MIRKSSSLIYISLLSLGLSACGVRKEATPPSVKGEAIQHNRAALDAALAQQRQSWTAIKARLDGELRRGDKSISARIQLQAARDKGIRLSVHYILFEVARVWFTPSGVTFVDLVNGGYAQEPYSKFGERLGIIIDYPQIENLILGGVFAPGKGASEADIRTLSFAYTNGQGPQLIGKLLGHNYVFQLNPQGQLNKLVVNKEKGAKVFEAEYRSEAQATLPTLQAPAISEYRLYALSDDKQIRERGTLLLEWQSVQHLIDDSELSLQPIIKPRYDRIDLDKLINALK